MCAKKRPNESQAKRMKEGFFFEGLTSALSDSDKSRTSGRHSTKDSPQYLTILAKVKKASRNWHFSPLKISKDALRESGKSSCAKKRTWNINDIDLHPCHGKGKNSVCFQSITYFLHNFFSSASSPLAICMAPPPNSPPSIRRSCVSWLITVSKQTGAVRPFAVINLLLSFCFRRAFVSGQKLGRR